MNPTHDRLATVLGEHEESSYGVCSCGWEPSSPVSAPRLRMKDWHKHVADALLAALPPPRAGDAAEEELGALLERLSVQGGVCFRRWESDGRTHADSAEFEVSGATPLAALQALDAALAEQQQQKSKEEV